MQTVTNISLSAKEREALNKRRQDIEPPNGFLLFYSIMHVLRYYLRQFSKFMFLSIGNVYWIF